jgi:glycosyltransferase involved in cell wall biosynthesis
MLYVIIPVYNCEKYLEEAVNSVLTQPWKEIRIVIVDDGSTDASGQFADSIAERNEAVAVLHQENAGVSAARNAGIDYVLEQDVESDGYIAFLDADDLWAKNAVDEETASLMDSHEYDLLCFNMCHVNETLTRSDVPAKYEEASFEDGVKAVYRHPQTFGSILYSARLLGTFDLRYFADQSYSEDKIFRMQCMFLSQRVLRLNRILYFTARWDLR